jgi:hypothetical protein
LGGAKILPFARASDRTKMHYIANFHSHFHKKGFILLITWGYWIHEREIGLGCVCKLYTRRNMQFLHSREEMADAAVHEQEKRTIVLGLIVVPLV